MSKYLIIMMLALIVLSGCEKKTGDDPLPSANTTQPAVTPVTLDPDDQKMKDLVDMVNIHSIFYGVSEYLYASDYISADTIDNGKKLAIAVFYATSDSVLSDPTKEEMDVLVKDVFGPDASHVDENFDLGTYDENTGRYTLSFGVGGAFVPYYEYENTKAVKEGDLLMIDETVIRIEPKPLDESYSEDMSVKSDLYTADGKTLLASEEHLLNDDTSFLAEYHDDASVYRYTFKEIGDRYYFYSFERIS